MQVHSMLRNNLSSILHNDDSVSSFTLFTVIICAKLTTTFSFTKWLIISVHNDSEYFVMYTHYNVPFVYK